MSFDIHQLDQIDAASSFAEEALENYQQALIKEFVNSPEGQAYPKTQSEMGFWVEQLIYYGYQYFGVTVPKMTVSNVDDILTEIFPRKISLSSDDEADDAIPELVAFWQLVFMLQPIR